MWKKCTYRCYNEKYEMRPFPNCLLISVLGTDIPIGKTVETESSSTETDQKLLREGSQQDNSEKNRKLMNRKSSVNFDQVESLCRSNSQKAICKPLEAVKNHLPL